METIKKNINKIVVVIVMIFVATFAYNYINKKETVDVVEEVIGEQDAVARNIIEALNELSGINIDYNFFTQDLSQSPNLISFSELVDFSEKELREKEIGKKNPFVLRSSPFSFNNNRKEVNINEEDIVSQDSSENKDSATNSSVANTGV